MIPQELLQKIHHIQIVTEHLARDLLAGAYRSAFKGKGMEFEEVREYVAGDEVRSIDWNVTAKFSKPYVKLYREERELPVHLIVDNSSSSLFGTFHAPKRDYIAEVASVLAFSALKSQDRVGLIQFSGDVDRYFPPKKGERHVLRLVRELFYQEPKKRGSNLASALRFLGQVQRKSGVCFIISDFICPDFSTELLPLSKQLDLIAIAVRDPRDNNLPDIGLVNFQDAETGECKTLDTHSEETRALYARQASASLDAVRQLMNRVGGGFVALETDKPYTIPLKRFFKSRINR